MAPTLDYLILYNPTLQLEGTSDLRGDEGEDAAEAGQIVFYSSNGQLSTRDRMLRQLGLAKGLDQFAGWVPSELNELEPSR